VLVVNLTVTVGIPTPTPASTPTPTATPTPPPGGDSLWEQAGNTIFYLLGNVGIGTDDPRAKLDVAGDIRLSGDLLPNGDLCIGTCP
jgi:hypothetical protein